MSQFFLLIILTLQQSVHGGYHYAGCYTEVFRETFFTSSFMEPTLCFRLCDTPIIYLQKTVCRCSGGGLMHHDKQEDKYCSIPCTKPADRQVKTANTCGGQRTYSAYVENDFYARHGHLFNYQIHFLACEKWPISDTYETYQVQIDKVVARSSLNKMERCAAACLDYNVTTKSIAFNDDNNRCLCIMPWKTNTNFERTNYLKILSKESCNRYCNNTSEDSNVNPQFQCGALDDPRVWAIYDLSGTCSTDYVYIKEFRKCFSTYRSFWNSCTLPAKSFVYDGSASWNDVLNMISTLKLNDTSVIIDFDEDVLVNSSWKCPRTASDSSSSWHSRLSSGSFSSSSTTRYVLDDGCLRENAYSSYSHRYSNRLCIANPLNRYSLSNEDDNNSIPIPSIIPQLKFCPTNWFDLNQRCYRMSDERKSIRNARNSCITISAAELNRSSKTYLWIDDQHENETNDYDDDQLNDSPTGEIVQYFSDWQARLGFFLLDTIPETDQPTSNLSQNIYYEDLLSLDGANTIYHSTIDEFLMINPSENKSSNINDDSCVILTRVSSEEVEKPMLKNSSMTNYSQAKHVLCETKTLIVRNFQQGCFRKPLILDLPALISNRLTYELCLSVCKELQTTLVILQMNKCYCVNVVSPKMFDLTEVLAKYQQLDCGQPCSGNRHELCGNENTIVVFHILDPRRTPTDASTPAQPFPDFTYDSCIAAISLNASTTYQFHMDNLHPRHCLELCTKHRQKYALINANDCFCTNLPVKTDHLLETLANQECSLQCSTNYFYTCGSADASTVYSVYVMKPQCQHGFEVSKNEEQCVYAHLSVKKNSFPMAQSYCQTIGGHLAAVNDISDILNVLPDTILNEYVKDKINYGAHMRNLSIKRYFWINRTSNKPSQKNILQIDISRCSEVPDKIDPYCFAIHYQSHKVHTFLELYQTRPCLTESNECSNQSATPFCVDQHVEPRLTLVPSVTDVITSKVSTDYSCGDNHSDYHFIEDYCYKILFHEMNWEDAKAKCELENAMLFVPEKSITLHMIKSLYLRRNSYTASGFAHVGVMYDYRNSAVIQYNTSERNSRPTIPDSNAVYDLCEKTFLAHYTTLMSATDLSTQERNRLKTERIGCAYIDLLSYTIPVIRCDEIPCNRTAAVICQKPPIVKSDKIRAKRTTIIISTTTTTPSSSNVIGFDSSKSIVRDFAPIFFVLAILFALILLGFLSTLFNHRLSPKNNILSRRANRTPSSVYSQLSSADEFGLN